MAMHWIMIMKMHTVTRDGNKFSAPEFLHNTRLCIDGFSEYARTVAVVKDNDWINIDISTMANMR